MGNIRGKDPLGPWARFAQFYKVSNFWLLFKYKLRKDTYAAFFEYLGAGIATVVISFWLCTYYNVIISWAMFYLVSSFRNPLPWISCNNWWNSDNCWDVSNNSVSTGEISSTQEFFE